MARAHTVHGAQGKALATLTAIDGRTHNWRIIYDTTLPRPSPTHDRARTYQEALNTMGSQGVTEVLAEAGITTPEDQSLLRAWWFSIVSTTITWWADHPDRGPADMTEHCLRAFTALNRTG
ncbi:hypothetical protein [Nocardia acidivorans]|uniref:hypothetical protein n=1 Tax=Nocardia acidivorans TaxID=404580 RepID=UPI000835FF24|nr:hypothetical protein [Nocardia acidivorans]